MNVRSDVTRGISLIPEATTYCRINLVVAKDEEGLDDEQKTYVHAFATLGDEPVFERERRQLFEYLNHY